MPSPPAIVAVSPSGSASQLVVTRLVGYHVAFLKPEAPTPPGPTGAPPLYLPPSIALKFPLLDVEKAVVAEGFECLDRRVVVLVLGVDLHDEFAPPLADPLGGVPDQ